MIATAAPQRIQPATKNDRSASRYGPVCQWRLVDHFNTVEDAEQAVDDLRDEGIQAQVSLIDGLSVIAKRDQACDLSLCQVPVQ
ncbi:MAG: hypothetical protein HQ518_31890 [Rhodopirellula sp.]|nr:hypothetical protein [Rhodopirellula sp.]